MLKLLQILIYLKASIIFADNSKDKKDITINKCFS